MLVLRRKANQAIVLNDIIVIRILAIEFNAVKIGIQAPPDVIVVREELLYEERPSPQQRQQPYQRPDDFR